MILFNCNRNNVGENSTLNPCLEILKKITGNLQNASSEEEFKKFSRIRKSKIEKNVLSLDGALDFLFAIGFTLDKNDNDWIFYDDNIEESSSKMSRIIELLNQPQIFDIFLDRQVKSITDTATASCDDDDDVRITGSDVKRLQQGMEKQREINEMMVSKATKDKLISGVGLQEYRPIFTVLKFKMPIADECEVIQAHFRSSEKFSIVRQWFNENFAEFFIDKTLSFKIAGETLNENVDGKNLEELKLIPAATLFILAK